MRGGLALLSAVALLSACGDPQAPVVARVLVCGESVARVVLALSAGRRVLGADSASRSLPGLGATADLGDACSDAPVLAPSLAAEVALLDGNAPGLAGQLGARGMQTRVLAPGDLNGVLSVYRELGSLLGADTRALALQAEMTRGISAIAARRHGRPRRRVAWLLEAPDAGGQQVVVGGVGIQHELLELAGAENAFHAPSTPRHRVSGGELLAAAPELLLVATGATGLREPALAEKTRRLPEALLRAPILDPLDRVRALYALLYPEPD
jgi:ABC-type hemin transport system substrate-binding protein